MTTPVLGGTGARTTRRFQLAAICLGLTLLVFSQSSGLEAADTKLDLVVAPWRFLSHAVTMWDPTAGSGQLQDQAYGYLFPMGPFFLIGHWMQLPAWVVQRSWESLLLVVAFLGTVRLSRLLGVKGFWPRVASGLAYALAPRMLMEIGVISSELLPVVVAPWVLIPLVRGSLTGSPRRAAAASGVALLFASGINASATLAILPLPALWLLSRRRGPRRAALMRWWVLSVTLACLWWVVPLVVLGRYGSPFLNWIESSAVTTSPTSLATSLRGSEHWEAYLGPGTWPAGWDFVSAHAIVLATAVVALVGVVGISLRRTPHRLFLASSLTVGLILITFGHVDSIGPLFAGRERLSLDGALNAFRNIHKFDPVVRLPVAIGLGNAVAAAAARLPDSWALRMGRRTTAFAPMPLAAMVAVAVAVIAIAPAIGNELVPQTRSVNEPSYWTQAGSWLGDHPGRTLVVPGAAQPVYIWGSPRDDALQPVADGPWAVRDAAPEGQPGYVRLLDEIEQQLSEGQRSTALSDLLTSAGIRYVMVRRDLDTGLSGSTPLLYTELTLENTPGFTQVAHFGPNLSAPSDPNRLTDFGATRPAGSVTVYQNPGWQGAAALLPTSQAVAANGSADSLTQLSAAGVGPDSPVLFGSASKQATDAHPETVLDDGVRRREFGFGGISQYSATMTATQPFTTTRAAHDYLPSPGPPLSTVKYLGIGGVSASSSGADADAILNASPENGPWSALDGRPKTAWRIGDLSGAVGQWWQVNLLHSINAPSINVAFAGEGSAYPSRIRVTTATGSLDQNLSPDGLSQPVALPAGPTQMVRITFLAVAGGSPGYGVGITAVTIAGVTAQRTLVVPNSDVPDVMSFAVAEGNRPKCLTVSDSPGCESSFVRHGEEDTTLDRSFTLSTDQAYRVHALLHLKNGPYLNNLLDRGNPLRAIASSTNSADPRNRAGAAVDGSDATGWVAAAGDRNPALTISTKRRVVLRGLRITSIADSPTSRPTRVTVAASGHRYLRTLPPDGRVRFPAVRTRSVTVVVLNATLRSTTSSLNGKTQLLPVGIGEVRLIGRHAPRPDAPVVVGVGCRAGLTMSVNGTVVPLHLKASSTAVLQGSGVTAEPCRYLSPQTFHPTSSVMLQGGDNRLSLGSTALSRPLSLVLMKVGYVVAVHPGAFPLTTLHWSATNRSVRVSAPGAAILVVHENANAGWRATAGGQTLTSVMVDGWEQGWLVPAGTVGVIHLVYTPQRTVAAGLIAGAVAVLLLLGLLIVPPLWRRRPVPVSVGDGALRVVPAWIACLAAMTLLGAEAGLLIAVGALCLSRFLADDLVRSRSPWLVGGLLAVASAAEGLRTASSAHPLAGSPGVQLLCLAAIGIVLSGSLLFVGPSPGDGEPSEQRALEQVPAGSGHGGGS